MKISINVTDGFFAVDDKRFSQPPTFAAIAKMFGVYRTKKPIVTAAKATIHTFDDIGIWVYEEMGIVSQISILFSEPFLDFHPKSIFQGEFVIKSTPIRCTEDVFKVENNETWLDEWEAEGLAYILLEKISLNLNTDPETKALDEIGFWFKNKTFATRCRQKIYSLLQGLVPKSRKC